MDDVTSKIWVFVEQRRGRIADVGLEILGKALSLAPAAGWKVAAVLLGHGITSMAERLLEYGADEVLVADEKLLEDYCGGTYVAVLERAVLRAKPEVLLIGATAMGTDLAPRLAARLRTGLSAHSIDLELDSKGELIAVIPWSGGDYLGRISCPKSRPQMATINPGIFEIPEKREPRGCIKEMDCAVSAGDHSYRIVEFYQESVAGSSLASAEVIVAGGYGIGKKEDWHYVEELASLLNGAVGSTRPPVDEGWVEHDRMIGQSGRTVYPKLYIGVGISGHMHHIVGIKKADLTIAINQDPDAAVFDHCNVGLVGDFREIIPALIEELKNK
ncbi:MAG: electron transfer flavoprotein subunit alpha/FixB family protein [Syntrophales bacterium]|jgi:electron transfer flavoprotein alpha subunit|nr:electron transfer flavoprotein subunit alpha/FixB family protein [Syntrophales bacterium]MDY0044408.1 electron transfer flavoprotein subunit alpha/FixB family protein [Syntrophales bacterium]